MGWMPVRMILTEGTTADCAQAPELIAGMVAQYLLSDQGYDSAAIVAQAQEQGMAAVIPPRRHRKEPRRRPGPVPAAAPGGERISDLQAVAWSSHQIRQE